MNPKKQSPVNRVCFDLETEAISEPFRRAKSKRDRILNAPKMRLACVYLEAKRRYRFFTPAAAEDLLRTLGDADEIISFNADSFDFLVLRRHHGLKPGLLGKVAHIDMHRILSDLAGFHVSLDSASKLNLNKSKMVKGSRMAKLGMEALKKACADDVRLTYRLWRKYSTGELRVPTRFSDRSGPGEHMPKLCPECGIGRLAALEADPAEMTEGQQADYGAGLWGVAHCGECGAVVAWEQAVRSRKRLYG